MSRYILFTIAIAFMGSAYGQGGYLGRKTAVYAYGDISSYQPLSFYAKPWRKTAGLALARTVNRNLEISIAAQYTVGGAYPNSIRGRSVVEQAGTKENNLTGYGGKISFKRFRYTAGAISPLGGYWGMELSVDYYDVNDSFQVYGSYDEIENVVYNMNYIKTQVWFKLGWQTILGEHLLVGGEVRTGVPPVVIELTDSRSTDFWYDSRGTLIFQIFGFEGDGLMSFEMFKNLFVPDIHVAYLF
jgi:hypothetical protein